MINFEEIKKEYETITQKLSDPELFNRETITRRRGAPTGSFLNWEEFETAKKRKDYLEKIIIQEEELQDLRKKIAENKEILKSQEDPALMTLAEEEISQLRAREKALEKEFQNLTEEGKDYNSRTELRSGAGSPTSSEVPLRRVAGGSESRSPNGEQSPETGSAIVEIRAGTGGEEAALFADDLFRMYSKYAQRQGWKQKILDSRLSELSGFKEITFEISNGNVFSQMKYEGGVHRVQRIPVTEKSGRIHTSTASVAVLPKPKKAQIKIRPEDLKIDFYRASGPGGQYVNKRETAVRITHLSSGIAVTSQTERNQLQNRENALAILAAKLLEKKEMQEAEKIHGKRKAQIGWAKRAEKIRTYNFPQDRLTDHRIKKSWHNLEEIMEGKLDPIISTLQKSSSSV